MKKGKKKKNIEYEHNKIKNDDLCLDYIFKFSNKKSFLTLIPQLVILRYFNSQMTFFNIDLRINDLYEYNYSLSFSLM